MKTIAGLVLVAAGITGLVILTAKPSKVKIAALKNQLSESEKDLGAIYDKMTKSQIDFLYDVLVAHKYGNVLPDNLKLKLQGILLSYGINPT